MLQLEDDDQQKLCLTGLAALIDLATLQFPGWHSCTQCASACNWSAVRFQIIIGPALVFALYREVCIPLLVSNSELLVARRSQVCERHCADTHAASCCATCKYVSRFVPSDH